MNDAVVREALKRELIKQYTEEPVTLIIEELGVGHGAARVDIAIINSSLNGYEIKSDRDTLTRLPEQIRLYSDVFDEITLVVGYRHAFEALQIIPIWWGVSLVHMQDGKVHFSEARDPKMNPSLDPMAVASLLWRNETLSMLEKLDLSKGMRSKSRYELYCKLVRSTTLDELRELVREQLRARQSWRFGQEPM